MGAQVAAVNDLHQFEVAMKTALEDEATGPWVIEARTCAIETPVLPSRVKNDTKGGY
jgi:hypothetical protein